MGQLHDAAFSDSFGQSNVTRATGEAANATRPRLSPVHLRATAVVLEEVRRLPAASTGSHLSGGRFKCPFCSKAFAHQWHLGRHVRIHTGDRPFRCHVCPMAFNQKSTLMGHLRRHTGDKPYQCHLCRMVFSWKSALAKHLQQHGVMATYQTLLPLCLFSLVTCSQEHCVLTLVPAFFMAATELNTGSPRTAECSAWPEVSVDPPAATAPLPPRGRPAGVANRPRVLRPDAGIININIRPYKCPHCDKGFADQWHLRRHVRIHTGDRPFACPFCPMAFNQKNTLIGHMRRHTGDKPYRCQFCRMAFSWKSTFAKHVQQHGSEHLPLPIN
ncbi:zinc finger protein 358-like [Dermacentor albipictus]|uniref:zinc finger protein 358-like n=1 Tax=Dermacentor albipictus TaxID=60249 RepID=UPI0038FCC682